MNNDSSILLKMKDRIYIYIKKLRKDKEREKEDSPSIDLCSPKPYVIKPPLQQHQSVHSHMRSISTLKYAKVNNDSLTLFTHTCLHEIIQIHASLVYVICSGLDASNWYINMSFEIKYGA